jgi:hypothetical protein
MLVEKKFESERVKALRVADGLANGKDSIEYADFFRLFSHAIFKNSLDLLASRVLTNTDSKVPALDVSQHRRRLIMSGLGQTTTDNRGNTITREEGKAVLSSVEKYRKDHGRLREVADVELF